MLEQLFGSRTRVKLLRLFLLHPQNTFFVREMTRTVGEQINSVRRELENLRRIGLIAEASEPKKAPGTQRKYYHVVTSFPLYHELRALVMKARMALERDIGKAITKLGQIQYLALCGLFIDDSDSITDVFIVGRINREKLKTLLSKMSRGLERELNYTVMSKGEYDYRHDITDRFLYRILEGKKVVVINRLTHQPTP